MLRLLLWSALVLLGLAAAPSKAVAAPDAARDQAEWLPLLENSSGLLLVAVTANGRQVTALIDTGFAEVVASPRLVASLGKPVQPLGRAVSIGGLQAFGRTTGLQIALGTRNYPPMDVEVGEFAAMERVLGQPFDLVIGTPLLRHAVLDVDLDRSRVRIAESATAPADADVVPLGYNEARGRFEVKAITGAVEIFPVMLDTGSDGDLTVSADTFAKLPKPAGRVTTTMVAGGGGTAVYATFTLGALQIGSARVSSTVVDEEPAGGFLAQKGAAALVGMSFLHHFNFILDGTTPRLYLRSRAAPVSPAARSTVGVQGDYRADRIFIMHVMANSPAEKAGLKPGDEICAVNGVKVLNGWANSPMRDWGTRPSGRTYAISLCSGRTAQLVSADFY